MNDLLMISFKISLVIFMASSLLDMGMRLNLPDAFKGLRDVRFVAYTLIWSFVICPALAYVITLVVPMERPYAIGMLLLGMAPCAPFVPMLAEKAKGDLGYIAAFMLLTAVGTVVFMPVAVPLLVKGLSASPWSIAKPLLVVVMLPMAIGVILRLKREAAAAKLQPVVKKLAGLAGLVFVVVLLLIYGKGLLGLAGELAVLSEFLFFGLLCAGTYWLGFGMPHEQKIVLSVGVTTRNIGACLSPLLAVPDMDQRATLMMALSLPMMVIVVKLGAKWFVRSSAPVTSSQEPAISKP
jgi:BASS family bile acid:Na+ symporter